ncbi:hypothetical protein FHS18_001701 [Paenibacillus phyllosphaerae]|uniref:Uncharacterized protein n=1 Tax=Paenibacillus phyllosphaerae TaxID=274593 RepID=A0A7W5AVN7_9BACL|nr:hypothetical protein [Paenibacillus phyllosphaerae]
MSSLAFLKQSKVKYLLLLPSSVITIIVLSSSYISIFGFEYQHRFREEYIGPSTYSKMIGVGILVGYLILTYILTWFYNRDISETVTWLLRSLFNTLVIVIVGVISSLPLLFPAYFSLLN